MIIYKCIISDDEMFSDIYKIKDKGFYYEVEGKTITRTEGGIDDSLIGGNASAEEVVESSESNSISGVDIVLNHHLKETSYTKKDYTKHLKDYMKAIKDKLQETNPDRVDGFKNDAPEAVQNILKNFKNYQFFTGESMNIDGMVALLDYREDGITPFMLFMKDGLLAEKC